MARGKSTTTANHVRDPTGQPKGFARSELTRAIDALSTQRAKNEQCSESLRNPCNTLMLKKLWRIMERCAEAYLGNYVRDFTGLLRSATK